MSDTPDFDKMTPDEIMKWMESLAKRQGAVEGFTTAADMQVAEVSEDDERAQGLTEYVPFEWRNKPDEWHKKVAAEEAEKKRRAAAAPPATAAPAAAAPPPPAVPEPAAAQPAAQAAPAAGDTPDFDKMSPDEIMKWMESLAKRQGAVEGFTTAADMDVAEVSVDDERAQGLTEYVPFEWRNKPDEWHKKVAAEEEEKKRRAAAQPPTTAPAPAASQPAATLQPPAPTFNPPPVEQPAASVQPADTLDSFFNAGGLPILETEDEDDETVAASANPMDWLTDLTGENDEGIGSLAGAELDDPFKALEALASGETDTPDSMDWLAELSDTDNSLDALAGLADLAPDDPLKGLDDIAASASQTVSPPSVGPGEGVDPLAWMESLAREQGADPSELITDADVPIARPAAVPSDGPGYKPYTVEGDSLPGLEDAVSMEGQIPDWLNADEEEVIGDMESDSPEDWLDQLASGVSHEDEAAAQVSASIVQPDDDEDVEDVDPDEVMKRLNQAKDVSPEEIEGMFDALFKKAEEFADRDEEEFPIPEDEPSGAIEAQIPDWLAQTMVESAPKPPTPEASIDDVLAGLDAPVDMEIEAEAPAAAQGEMPDWLNNMGDTIEAGAQSAGSDAAVDMPDWLNSTGDDVAEAVPQAEEGDIPDWLKADAPDTGNIQEDIFAAPEAPKAALPATGTLRGGVELEDTGDPWVEAFTEETEHADQLAQWYAEQTGQLAAAPVTEAVSSTPAPAPVQAQPVSPAVQPAAAALQVVELPVEADLPAGEPEAVPDWLVGDAEPAFSDVLESDATMPDWLNAGAEDIEEMPDWLKAGVDDSVTAGSADMPDWLDGMDVGDEEIPGWLIDTMQSDEQPAVSVDAFTLEAEPSPVDTIVAPPPAARPKASPAPVPVVAASINVSAALQSARSKVSGADIDGALLDYESIVRANAALDDVVNDLSKLADDKSFKKNPAIFRVLGDGLMRRGNLQQALDTYRKALNLL